jgi:uncharacterized protein YceK
MYKILLIAGLLISGCSLIEKEKEEGEKAKVVMNNIVRIESSSKLMYFQGAANYDDNGNGYVMATIENDRVVSLTDD